MRKTKIMISGKNLHSLKNSSKYLCGVSKGVGTNSIFCTRCQLWMHNKCSSMKSHLKDNHRYLCKRFKEAGGRPEKQVTLKTQSLM